jgi:hypothetical protein
LWFFGLGTPGLQKTTWPINHYGIPLIIVHMDRGRCPRWGYQNSPAESRRPQAPPEALQLFSQGERDQKTSFTVSSQVQEGQETTFKLANQTHAVFSAPFSEPGAGPRVVDCLAKGPKVNLERVLRGPSRYSHAQIFEKLRPGDFIGIRSGPPCFASWASPWLAPIFRGSFRSLKLLLIHRVWGHGGHQTL